MLQCSYHSPWSEVLCMTLKQNPIISSSNISQMQEIERKLIVFMPSECSSCKAVSWRGYDMYMICIGKVLLVVVRSW